MARTTEQNLAALADGLTQSADAIHARLRKALKGQQIDPAVAQRLFQDEAVLRQRANALYLGAATCVLGELQQTQQSLLDLVATANARITASKSLTACLDVLADLLVLAAAACTAKAEPLVAAWQQMQKDVEAMGGTGAAVPKARALHSRLRNAK